MSFTYITARNDILTLLGVASGDASDDVKARIYRFLNEGVRRFQEWHPDYYRDTLHGRRAVEATQPTATIAGTLESDVATMTYTGNWQDLVGAILVKEESGVEYRNVIRYVSNTTTKAVRLLWPSKFSNGTVTIYPRSVVVSSRVTVARYRDYPATLRIDFPETRQIPRISAEAFFDWADVDDPLDQWPSFWTVVNDIPIFNTYWALTPDFSMSFAIERDPTLYTTDETIAVDIPDSYQGFLEYYAAGQFLMMSMPDKAARYIAMGNLGLSRTLKKVL